MNDMLAEVLAYSAPLGNVASALLTGPLLLFIWSRYGRSKQAAAERAAPWNKTGWAVLLTAQITLAAFGWVTGYAGLQIGPLMMIGAATVNYLIGRQLLAEAAQTTVESKTLAGEKVVAMRAAPIRAIVEPGEVAELRVIVEEACALLNHHDPATARALRDRAQDAQFAAEGTR